MALFQFLLTTKDPYLCRLHASEAGDHRVRPSRPTFISLTLSQEASTFSLLPLHNKQSLLLLPPRRLSVVSDAATIVVDRRLADNHQRRSNLTPSPLIRPGATSRNRRLRPATAFSQADLGEWSPQRRQTLATTTAAVVCSTAANTAAKTSSQDRLQRPPLLTASLDFLMTPPPSSSSFSSSPSSSSTSVTNQRVGRTICRHCGGRVKRSLRAQRISLPPIGVAGDVIKPPRWLSCSCGQLAAKQSPAVSLCYEAERLTRSVSFPGRLSALPPAQESPSTAV
jgi:hypothetical protein